METLGESTAAEDYFSAVEELFARLRGRPLLLGPRDVARVNEWHQAGVPLRVVERALEKFFERELRRTQPRRRPATIEYCERDVFEVWEDWRTSQLGAATASTVHPGSMVSEGAGTGDAGTEGDAGSSCAAPPSAGRATPPQLALARSRITLARLAAEQAHAGILSAALIQAEALLGALDRPGRPSDADAILSLESELSDIDAMLLAAACAQLGPGSCREINESAGREVARISGGMDEAARDLLVRKTEERAIRARFGLPRLALFSF